MWTSTLHKHNSLFNINELNTAAVFSKLYSIKCFTISTWLPPWWKSSVCRRCSTTTYLVVAVVTSSLSFWVRTLNSWLKSTGRNRMITGILSMLRRPWRRMKKTGGGGRGEGVGWKGQVRGRQRGGEKYIKKKKAGQMQFGNCRIAQQKHWFSSLSQWLKMDSGLSLTFRQLRKLEVGGSERSSSLFWHCWKNRFKWGSWHKEEGPSKRKVRIWWWT